MRALVVSGSVQFVLPFLQKGSDSDLRLLTLDLMAEHYVVVGPKEESFFASLAAALKDEDCTLARQAGLQLLVRSGASAELIAGCVRAGDVSSSHVVASYFAGRAASGGSRHALDVEVHGGLDAEDRKVLLVHRRRQPILENSVGSCSGRKETILELGSEKLFGSRLEHEHCLLLKQRDYSYGSAETDLTVSFDTKCDFLVGSWLGAYGRATTRSLGTLALVRDHDGTSLNQ